MISYNFESDLKEYLEAEFKRYFPNTNDLGKNLPTFDLVTKLLNIKRRIPGTRPRLVQISRELESSSHIKNEGLEFLIESMTEGQNLRPFLGENSANSLRYQDPLLNYWSIHHFHLDEKFNKKGMIERSKLIAMARMTDDVAYIINIVDHNHETGEEYPWTLSRLIQIIYDNWPNLLHVIPVTENHGEISSDQVLHALRSNGYNTPVYLRNGAQIFPSMGVLSGGGFPLEDNLFYIKLMDQLRIYENIIDHVNKTYPSVQGLAKAIFDLYPFDLSKQKQIVDVRYIWQIV